MPYSKDFGPLQVFPLRCASRRSPSNAFRGKSDGVRLDFASFSSRELIDLSTSEVFFLTVVFFKSVDTASCFVEAWTGALFTCS